MNYPFVDGNKRIGTQRVVTEARKAGIGVRLIPNEHEDRQRHGRTVLRGYNGRGALNRRFFLTLSASTQAFRFSTARKDA